MIWVIISYGNGLTPACLAGAKLLLERMLNYHQFDNWQQNSMNSKTLKLICKTAAFCAGTATPWPSPVPLRWRHNGGDSVSNHQPRECLPNRLIRCRSKNPSKLRVAGLCVGNSPGTGEFPAQMASNAENVSIWWRHHDDALLQLHS